VTNPEPREAIFQALIKAAGEVGIRHNPDYNGAQQDGVAMSQASIAGGRRMSTAACYLDPIRGRANLHIETEALAEKLMFQGRRCIGVRYRKGDQAQEAQRAARSHHQRWRDQFAAIAGTVRDWLCRNACRSLGIETLHALPGVGENLRDHYAPRTRWAVGAKGYTLNDRGRGLGLVEQALRYALTGKGMLGSWRPRYALLSFRGKGWKRLIFCSVGCRPSLNRGGMARVSQQLPA
jgi:choline dehydrogenase